MKIKIALAGNPNAGKTTVFNALCGARQRTGNFAGVTVEKKSGTLKEHSEIEILDVPGTYSLKAKSTDETIAANVLTGNYAGETKPDIVLVIIDASNLKRSLYLVGQLQELGVPMLGAVTMTDIAARRGLTLDIQKLEHALGFPLCEVTKATGDQIAALTQKIVTSASSKTISQSSIRRNHAKKATRPRFTNDANEMEVRYRTIDAILKKVIIKALRPPTSITARIDRVLTHRLFGLFAFTVIIGSVFFSIYAGAQPMMDGIDGTMKMFGGWVRSGLSSYPVTASLIADGMIAGAGSVIVFLPQIMILFFFISVLEETGYMARAAFMVDKLLGWTGLNGRSFIPLLSSFACAIPGILSARAMPNGRARMATILVAPLMSCSARLPVYVLFIGAFIEPRAGALWAAVALFGMHLVGIVVALPLAYLLNRKVLKAGEGTFMLELPEYRLPHWPNVFRRVYDAGSDFIKTVGTIVFALSVVIWALVYFPHSEKTYNKELSTFAQSLQLNSASLTKILNKEKPTEKEEAIKTDFNNALRAAYLRDSLMGRFGRTIEPIFEPLGFDWKISVAVLSAFPAREVFVSTLGIIFSVTDAEDNPTQLGTKLVNEKKSDGTPAYSILVAISIMVFFALCAQCMSTLATIRRELMSTRWAVTVFVVLTTLAYLASLGVYQIGRLFV
ncbi:MAG: Fe(2+) transporter FeoB [Turneriella sp.]|nr:Fe(2+) transporter FeoB [Turneriella sp.]